VVFSKTKSTQKIKWAIIGSGVAGLASAIRLRALGAEVDVFESNSFPGGKLSEFTFSGFRFDAGPSLFTMPQWLQELFEIHKKDFKAYFQYQNLKESCLYFYEDGTRIHGYCDKENFAREISLKTMDTEKSVLDFFLYSQTIYKITNPIFLQRSLHRISTYFSGQIIPSILGLPKIDALRNMNKANETFFKDPKTIQIFNRFATYNGSNPYLAPATLNVISHLENHFGAYFPVKGMVSIIKSMEQLALDCGVKINYNQPVEEILLKKNKVQGIRVSGEFLPYNGVISNMDIYHTYHQLLPKFKNPKKTLARERSSSALIFYWGINREFPDLGLHNIFFSGNYKLEFEAIKERSIDEDPTIYINITSKLKKDDAPLGMENWFTMINVPANTGQNWDDLIIKSRKSILKKLSRILNLDIEACIVAEKILDPRLIEQRTSAYQGSLYGSSSNHSFAAFFRHPNFTHLAKGLYFSGGSVHPGGGIPLALLSAKITTGLISKIERLKDEEKF
jgi:phytoene desaturase